MIVIAMPAHGRWVGDLRGEGRSIRVSAHADVGFLILSTWRAGACVATVRLRPDEAAELMAGLANGLAHLANVPSGNFPDESPAAEDRLRDLERRLLRLESPPPPATYSEAPAG